MPEEGSEVTPPEGNLTAEELQSRTHLAEGASQPIKIAGSALDYVLMVPKGAGGGEAEMEATAMAAKKEAIEATKLAEDANAQASSLEELNKKLSEQNDALQEQLSKIDTDKRETLAARVVDSRIEKGLMEKEERADEITKLSKLDADTLVILEEDTVKLSKVATTKEVADPKASAEELARTQLSDEQTTYNTEREKLGLAPKKFD